VPNPRKPDGSVITTCAYCGVGCGFKAETIRGEVVRMIPWKEGKANHGHACVKGRFAFDYYRHPDRVKTPMIRASIDEPWREVSWDVAIAHAASEMARKRVVFQRERETFSPGKLGPFQTLCGG
jgi:formate dehydrogenase major subunit